MTGVPWFDCCISCVCCISCCWRSCSCCNCCCCAQRLVEPCRTKYRICWTTYYLKLGSNWRIKVQWNVVHMFRNFSIYYLKLGSNWRIKVQWNVAHMYRNFSIWVSKYKGLPMNCYGKVMSRETQLKNNVLSNCISMVFGKTGNSNNMSQVFRYPTKTSPFFVFPWCVSLTCAFCCSSWVTVFNISVWAAREFSAFSSPSSGWKEVFMEVSWPPSAWWGFAPNAITLSTALWA